MNINLYRYIVAGFRSHYGDFMSCIKGRWYSGGLIFFIGVLFLSTSCRSKKKEHDPNVFYTCSMDPQIMEKEPGTCPICKMDLTKTIVSPSDNNYTIKLSDTQIKLANIKTTIVDTDAHSSSAVLRGTLTANKKNRMVISARASGRVDRLYFKTPGEKIEIGEKVYGLYSEELQAAQQQYLLLKEKSGQIIQDNINYEHMLQTAKNKLLVWGLTPRQVDELKMGDSNNIITFYSNVSGVINEISINEGEYISEGTVVMTVEDYNTLWVEAEVYPDDLKSLASASDIKVRIEGMNEPINAGKLVVSNPEVENNKRYSLVTFEIANRKNVLKPGMRANIEIYSRKEKLLYVPKTAVLREGNMDIVWLKSADNKFSPKMIHTGKSTEHMIEVVKGVKAGDTLVHSGVYLLNSEYKLRNGNSPMAGMDHSNH